jgi:putative oxidoreductase
MSSTMRGSLAAYAHSLLRIVSGFLFTFHGAQKIFGMFGGIGGHGATAPFLTLRWVAGILELVGGPLVVLGFLTRFTAFILAGEMAVAYFTVHILHGFWPIENDGEPPVLFCFIFLYLAASGAGLFSLDDVLWGKPGGSSSS